MVTEAVIQTIGEALTAFCLCTMAGIVATAFWKGRGMESVWPEEAPELETPDIPRSAD